MLFWYTPQIRRFQNETDAIADCAQNLFELQLRETAALGRCKKCADRSFTWKANCHPGTETACHLRTKPAGIDRRFHPWIGFILSCRIVFAVRRRKRAANWVSTCGTFRSSNRRFQLLGKGTQRRER